MHRGYSAARDSNMSLCYHYCFQKPPLVLERLQISLAFDIDTAQALVNQLIQSIDVRAITFPLAFLTSSFPATSPASGY
jgi:hypothetical protein